MAQWHLHNVFLARVGAVSESATLAIDAKAKALRAAGEDVIGFGAGEPDFPTPAHIVEAAVAACRDPKNHRYTPAAGLPELREAIAAKTARDTGFVVKASQVLVTNGGKQAVEEAFATLLDPGDEVLMPAPYWTTYPETISLGGRRPDRGADQSRKRLQGVHLPTGGCSHASDQSAAVRVPFEPDGRGLQRGGDGNDWHLGGGARLMGDHRRDLRAPGLRLGPHVLDASPGARAR